MDYKKLCPIINAVGVIIMFIWGALFNGWNKSWIAVCVCGVISGLVYCIGKQNEKKE